MKKLLLKAARDLTKYQIVWWFIDKTIGRVSVFYSKLGNARSYQPETENKYFQFDKKCQELFSDLIVRHGPFKGMRYPRLESFGSSLFPKLLGSYESELGPAIREILRTPYTAIVDIGCAEGYYAVGFGMHFRDAKLYAFDLNEGALEMCHKMSILNEVNLTISGFCDGLALAELSLGNRALIFCDCEGYEMELIDQSLAMRLKDHDFLIETHDFINVEITKRVMDALVETHRCNLIESIDDTIKAYTYDFPELVNLSLSQRKIILSEGRPQIMRWIFARSKSHI